LPLTRQALHCAAIDLRGPDWIPVCRRRWPGYLAKFGERRMQLPAGEAQRLIDPLLQKSCQRRPQHRRLRRDAAASSAGPRWSSMV